MRTEPPPAFQPVSLIELVSTYLRAIAPSAYCDPCLATAVQEPVEPVRRTAEEVSGPGLFVRRLGRCKICRSTKRIVTRVDARRVEIRLASCGGADPI